MDIFKFKEIAKMVTGIMTDQFLFLFFDIIIHFLNILQSPYIV